MTLPGVYRFVAIVSPPRVMGLADWTISAALLLMFVAVVAWPMGVLAAEPQAPGSVASPSAAATSSTVRQKAVAKTPEPVPAQMKNTTSGAESPSAEKSRTVAVKPGSGAAPENEPTDNKPKAQMPARSQPAPAPGPGETARSKAANDNPFSGMAISPSRGPLEIRSDELELDYKNRRVIYRGNVQARQGSAGLQSDTLEVTYGRSFRDISQIIATGNVRISQAGRVVTGDKAVLDEKQRTIEITGNPVIHSGADQVAGKRILVYLDNQRTVIENASAVIHLRNSAADEKE